MNDAKSVTQNFVALKPAKLKRGAAESLLFNHKNDTCVGGEVETRAPDIDTENDHNYFLSQSEFAHLRKFSLNFFTFVVCFSKQILCLDCIELIIDFIRQALKVYSIKIGKICRSLVA